MRESKNSENNLMFENVDSIQGAIREVVFPLGIQDGVDELYLLRLCHHAKCISPITELSRYYRKIFPFVSKDCLLTASDIEEIISQRSIECFSVLMSHYEECVALSLIDAERWVDRSVIMSLVSNIKSGSGFAAALQYLQEEQLLFSEDERLTVNELTQIVS